jgi:hypothetical protein
MSGDPNNRELRDLREAIYSSAVSGDVLPTLTKGSGFPLRSLFPTNTSEATILCHNHDLE